MGGKDGDMDIGNWDSYPKKDSGEREWDRTYPPPQNDPFKFFIPPTPSTEWYTPSSPPQPSYESSTNQSSSGALVGFVAFFFLTVLVNGFFWAFLRFVCVSSLPNEPMACILVPAIVCSMLNFALLFFVAEEGFNGVGFPEQFSIAIAAALNIFLTLLMAIAEKAEMIGR